MKIKYINRQNRNIETENPPGEKLLNFLYNNTFGEKLALPIAKQKFITEWYGKMMNSAASTNRIQPFIELLNIDMRESKKKVEEFTSFNDFFYRKLKPGIRKIESGLVSPGDGKILAFQDISHLQHFFVKGKKFTLKEFLRSEVLAEKYSKASMVILRLAPNDYHRFHFPFNGIPSKSEKIEGAYYSVSPIALDRNFSRVFHDNKKEVCILMTEGKGEILICLVGASMVGSIISTYEPNEVVEKGEEMGYFAFGGSSIVLLINADHFILDEDLLLNTNNNLETKVRMGEKIGETK